MTIQSEEALENSFIMQLTQQGYERVRIHSSAELRANFKTQLEQLNGIALTELEFKRILNHLNSGSIFERAWILRGRYDLVREDNSTVYIEFIHQKDWSKNTYQVTNQVEIQGRRKNRYDVTLLVNGLPLIQVELKRRGAEISKAENQIKRYLRDSYLAEDGFFGYIQLFVVSNGVDTKYFSNNAKLNSLFHFYWTDENNKKYAQLSDFTTHFLNRTHAFNMITKYIVLAKATKSLMVLRPYQYYAVENMVKRVQDKEGNGYIWHTTGSGKTLTSYKASQIITNMPEVHKVVFVVDRKDLDSQTTKEFNSFSEGSVDGTDNTAQLVKQLEGETPLVVTTIQKLNNAATKLRYNKRLEVTKNQRIVFIFDECHRSQFGKTHAQIVEFFPNSQLFGFTGTPIFAENASTNEHGKRTTKDLFSDCLHKYVITDAISDFNVLRFSVEYVGKYKDKTDSNNYIDIDVSDIDTNELIQSPQRLEKITDYILAVHPIKSKRRKYTAVFCVSSIDTLVTYYNLFKKKREEGKHNLNIATIFSYGDNDDFIFDSEFQEGRAVEPKTAYTQRQHSERLEEYIGDYNKLFATNFNLKDGKSFYNYYNDVAKRVKSGQVDILLVVNMFLTGFDSKLLNTLYVDKNLKYHGLIQAYSRTNRVFEKDKTHGNIVCFRNLRENTNDAVALFSNKDALDVIFMPDYDKVLDKFIETYKAVMAVAPTLSSIDDFYTDEERAGFVKAFRKLLRALTTLKTYADFNYDDLPITEQEIADYTSKYAGIKEMVVKSPQEQDKASILQDIDFETELLQSDLINVDYILKLLSQMTAADVKTKEDMKKEILSKLSADVKLRSKRELIQKFIEQQLDKIQDPDDVEEAFSVFVNEERINALGSISKQKHLKEQELKRLVDEHLYHGREILWTELINLTDPKPSILRQEEVGLELLNTVNQYVDTYYTGMVG